MSFYKALNVIQIELFKTYVSPIYVITYDACDEILFSFRPQIAILIPSSFSAAAVERIYSNATNKLRHFNCSDFICQKKSAQFFF